MGKSSSGYSSQPTLRVATACLEGRYAGMIFPQMEMARRPQPFRSRRFDGCSAFLSA